MAKSSKIAHHLYIYIYIDRDIHGICHGICIGMYWDVLGIIDI